ncbi:non-ribosomal peptide synthase/polyketide synthase [Clostridium sporogenes]|uniref:non-ribosomal peptide synthase/polyketide synthase n=1 Tax=Clostridium sporogenes TaxID=1509 RepID=UPI003DA47DB7
MNNKLKQDSKKLQKIDSEDVKVLSEEEKYKVLYEFNDRKVPYPINKTVNELFEEVVDECGANIAVASDGVKLTYKELNKQANKVANFLRKKEVKVEDLIGVLCDRSIETIVVILGVIKAGAAYIPIDEEFPEQRIEYMLEDSRSKIFLGSKSKIEHLDLKNNVEKIFFEDDLIKNCSEENPANKNTPENLVYVIYTSGSTGNPKGVAIEHRGIANLVKSMDYMKLGDEDKMFQCGSLSFDVTAMQIWATLLSAAAFHIEYKELILDLNKFEQYIKSNKITTMLMPTALFNQIGQERVTLFETMKNVIIIGEVLSPKAVAKVFGNYPKIKIIDGYGPTENSVLSTTYTVDKNWTNYKAIPVGKPIPNSTVYIMDKNNKLLPIGVTGELCVGGDGVARGYLNREDLNKERFIENPYIKGERIYKTGDLARWLQDGNIDFLGRMDYQVKIRGYRIELGEIERELLKNEEIKETVVVDRKDENGDKYLCAFIVAVDKRKLDISEVKEKLSKQIPSYMLPTYIVQLESMPLNQNRKIDRKALPEIDLSQVDTEYVAPKNEMEEKICRIYSQILGIKKIGIKNNFFQMGGHSLKAIGVVSKLKKELQLKVEVSNIFSYPTAEELSNYLMNVGEKEEYIPIEKIEEKEYYKVSSVQKRMYAINQMDKENINYNMPIVLTTKQRFDREKTEIALNKIIERHEAFRTSFHVIDGELVQKVSNNVKFSLEAVKESCKLEEKDRVNDLIKNFIKPFNLEEGSLIRAEVIGLEDADVLVIDMHHIVSDGMSLEILVKDFKDVYEGKELKDAKVQYKDYCSWREVLIKKGIIKKQEKYWLDKFEGELPILNIPTDYNRPQIQDFEGQTLEFKFEEKLLDKLNEVLKNTGTTKHMVMLAAFNILLSKYSGQEDIIVGTPSAGRTHSDLDNTIGMFVNTLAIRNNLDGEMSFKEFLEEVKKTTLEAFENQDYQLDELIEKLNIKRESGRNPLFDFMFVMQNLDLKENKVGDLDINSFEPNFGASKFDLSLIITEEENETHGMIEYSTNLFKRESIERLQKHFENILESISEDVDIKLKDIDMLDEKEKQVLLKEFNDTKVDYPKDKSVTELFEEVVNESGDNIALSSNGIEVTYKELNEKANKIANFLKEKAIEKNDVVGILCDRSIETIEAILGVVKAGATYMPIDEEYPKQRIEYMLQDSESKILLGKENMLEELGLEEANAEIINIENEKIQNSSIENPDMISSPEDLIYIIYTSGSTGRPKGVAVQHRGVVRLVKNTNVMTFRENEKFLKNISMSFDPSALEIWGSLLNKMTLVVIKKEITMDINRLSDIIDKQDVRAMILPTPLFNSYGMDKPSMFKDMEHLIVGGDVISPKAISKVLEICENLKIINAYGPTENSVISTEYIVSGEWNENKTVPIGKPITNSTAYIMDENNRLLPIGTAGELCVGGDGVAKGYLNREDLNKEKFILNPYVEGETIYKTGDLARMLPDGNIKFLGRMDNQVKIRGYRIELGEIEKELLNNEEIKEAVVIDRKDQGGNKYICAFVVGEGKLSIDKMKEDIANQLPNYMVPTYIIQLDSMPLNQNGKIDKKALPEVDLSLISKEYVAPKNEIQKKFSAVIGEVLGLDKVSIKDSFFDIGGDSIKAIQVASRLRKYEINVEVKDILASKNIEMMAKCIKVSTIKAEQGVVEEEVIPTPIQKEFIEMQDKAYKHFNQAMMLYSKEGFDEEILKAVMGKIIEHHDALRMVIRKKDNKYSLYNKGLDGKLYDFYKFNYENIEDKDLSEMMNKEANSIQASMDLENGPLVKVALFKTKEGDHLLMAIHHHVVDGVSWRIILEDLSNGYKALKEGKKVELSSKTTSFKEWAEKQYEYSNSKKLLKELKYWKEVTDESVEQIPRDKEIKESTFKAQKNIIVKLNKEDTKNLLKESNRAYNTEINDILISSLGIAAKNWKGLNNLAITLEGHGREDILKNVDITRTIGWFTTTYPVVLDLNQEDIGKSIKKTKEVLRKVPNKGIGYGILKYLTLGENKNNEELELKTDIGFNYLGQFDEDTNNEVFKNSSMPTGNSLGQDFKALNSIEINSMISDGELNIDISYNSLEYNEFSIENFGDLYRQALKNVVKHCMEKEETEYIGVDYGVNEYSVEEIDELKDFVKKEIGENIVVEKINRLTSIQEGMLFTYLQNKKTTAYVLQLEFDIKGEIELGLLNKAYNELLKRHEALRTIIYQNNLHTAQVTLNNISGEVEYEDFSNLDNKQEAVESYKKNKVKAGFNIFKDLLFKFTLIKEEDNKYKLLINSHHIIVDGWSNQIIIGELLNIYKVLKNGEELKLEKSYNYDQYIKWLDKQDKEEALENWKNYLEGYDTTLTLPNETLKKVEYKEGEVDLKLNNDILNRLRKVASKYRVTMNVICSTILGITLQKYNNTDDVVFGTVVSGRPSEIEGVEKTVGIFINSIPVRINTKENESFADLVSRVQNESNELKSYEYVSLADIQNLTILKQNLIKYLMVFENYPVSEVEENKLGFKIKAADEREQTDYDFNISFEEEEGLVLKAMFNTNIYDEIFAYKFLKEMRNIFEAILENNEILVKDIDILDEKEKQVLIKDFNDTKSDYPRDKSITELFEEVVNESGDNIALSSNGVEVTYKELNEKANKIANFLKDKAIGKNDVVGILCDRSIETIETILGVVKAGATYMPIDEEYPKQRIEYMLKDSKSRILLGKESMLKELGLEETSAEITNIENEKIQNNSVENANVISSPEDLIYIIYTSGSTGRPKGVAVKHRGIVRLVKNTNVMTFKENEKFLKNISMSFDPSALEIWGSLLNKMTLVVIKKEITMDINRLANIIDKQDVKAMILPTPLFNSYGIEKPSMFKNLEYLIVGGDIISSKAISKSLKVCENLKIVNAYGPTENSVISTEYIVSGEWNENKTLPIGKPISNSTAYIMDKNNKLLPMGVAGELCVGGDGVAKGYLNREDLNKEKFILNPYVEGETIYKTGDLARMLPDRNIEFLGRIDNQVKIRGYRIELGEIEKELLKNEEIKESVVIDRKDQSGNKYICAYVVAESEINVDKMKEDITNELPIYMVPSYIVQLDSMPLNQNGKIDKKALPEADMTTIAKEYIAPRNEMEERICKIYSEVLGIENISIRDDFFDIGGHSLKAINVVSTLEKELKVKVEVSNIFTYSTVEKLSEYLNNVEEKVEYMSIEKAEEKEYYKASLVQKRMYAINQMDKESINYNMPNILVTKGSFHKEKIETTLNKIIERHEVFRTSFHVIDGELVQKINKNINLTLEVIKGSCKLEEKEKVNELIENFIRRFNLEKAPLIHAAIIKLQDADILAMDMHHIISDGVSDGIFTREFKDIYEGKELQDVKIQYKDFSEWQIKLKRNEIIKKQEEYWLNKFKGELPILNLSTDYKRPQVQSFEGDRVSFELDEKLLDKLNEVLKSTGTTKHMLMLAAFNVLLSKYSGQEDIIVGTPSAGRTHSDLNNTIGMFVNTLAIRNNLDEEMSFKEFLEEVKANTLGAFENQDYQLDELIEELNVNRESGRNPLFDVMFIMQNLDIEEMKIGDLDITLIEPDSKISKFDLSLMITEEKDKTYGMIEYSTNLFKRESIERLQNHFENILKSISEDIDIKLKDIELLSDTEKQVLLKEFNDTKVDYPRHESVTELFKEVVSESGNNIALSSNGVEITYKELNKRSNQIANFLIKKGVINDDIIGVLCDRSIETIVTILGVVKAGAAYMPIDEEYPEKRIIYMLEDSKSNILLGQKNNFEKLNLEDINVEKIYIESEEIKTENVEDPDIIILPEDMIYVIYTSGSTGKPKGVSVEHRGVVSLVKNTNHTKFREGYKYLKNISMSFDPSVLEIWGTLLNKMTLVVIKKEITMNIDKLGETIEKENIKVMNLPAPLFNSYGIENPKIFNGIECLQIGGDIISSKAASMVLKKCKGIEIVNGYGPTENTVTSTAFIINNCWDEQQTVPIGKPVSNSTAYIMDKNNKLLPIGVAGELCVGGDGVARGYLNREELTKEKFIENPYVKGERIYKTGDLARWLPAGNIEFLGRIDNQVKIRGYRIELGEIEKELLRNEKIKEAVVIDKRDQNGNKYLCAYIVTENKLNIDKIKEDISNELPSYMVPAYIVQLENISLNQNGKIDKKALPEVDLSLNSKEYVAPRDEVQRKFAAVIGEVLGLDKVGIKDSFFDIGGDSIKAIQVSSRLRKYEINIEVKDILASKNIEIMAKCIKDSKIKAEQGIVQGEVIATPIQKEFIEMQDKAYKHFNQAMMVYSEEGFDEEILKSVITKIIEHHDALRMVIRKEGNKYKLYNKDLDGKLYDFYKFNYENIEEKDLSEKINDEANIIQASMDLENGPLVKVALFKTKEEEHLLIVIHHHIVDGVSWRIILEDLLNGYKALKEGKKVELPTKTTSFKEWAEKQYKYSNSKKLLKELKYWKKITDKVIEEIPRDNKDKKEEIIFQNQKNIVVKLNKAETENLLKESNRAYNTETNDILINSLGIAVKKWTGLNNLSITLEGHGREDILKDVDITRTIGWFTTTYPVVLDLNQEDIGKSIKKTKETLRKVPNKGIGYGILKHLTLPKNKNHEELELKTDIGFNYLGQFDKDTNNEIFKNSNMLIGNSLGQDFKFSSSININSIIADGELNIDISYNSLEYKESFMESFGKLYKQALIDVVKHCMEKEETEYIGVDYGVNEYSIEEIDELKDFVKEEIGENIVVEKINKLTPIQEGMVFTYLQNKETTAYVLQLEFDIKGEIELGLLNKAYNELLKRHDILRTIIYQNNLHTAQVTLKNVNAEVEYEDFSNLDNKEESIKNYKKNKIKVGFNIFKDLLFKFTLIKEEDNKYKLLINSHHIIVDGWSNQIIIGDLLNIYKILKDKEELNLEKAYNYDEYIKWLEKQDKEEALEHWKNYLEGYDTTLTLPDEAKIEFGKEKIEYEEGNLSLKLEDNVLNKLRSFASKYRVTMGVICSTVLGITLQKYNNTDDVVFGTVVSGRPPEIEGVEKTVGIFINSIPVRINTKENESFADLVLRIQNESNKLKSYEYMSLANIQNLTIPKQNLIKYLMVFENYPASEAEENKLGFKINAVDGREQTDYDFNISFVEEEGLLLRAMVNKNIYNENFVNKFLKKMISILESVAENNEVLIKDIDILDEKEKQVLLKEFNDTKVDYPKDKSVTELFEEVVNECGDSIALSSNGIELTYKGLNEKANKIANFLKDKAIGKNDVVGILCDRSIETIETILGVVKAGATYMPIDEEYPKQRIEYMLKDSESKILLGKESMLEELGLEETSAEITNIENEKIQNNSVENANVISSPEDLIYIIYTSGSTGRPKGVAVKHRGIVRLVKNTNVMTFKENEKFLKNISMSFDPSALEIWGSLLNKMTLVVIKKEITMDINKLSDIIDKQDVKAMILPTPLFNSYGIERPNMFKNLEYLIVGGDVILPKAISKSLEVCENLKIVNAYGPTENSVISTEYIISGEWNENKTVSIGKPITNSTAYIMDKNNKLLPMEVAGELCVGGDGVARGYLNREDLNKEKFILNPYVEGETIYKTGDLARILPDGNIEFLGRIDNQVKIRGYRIELGEIEKELLKNEEIKESVVIDRKDQSGNKYICAYVVAESEINVDKIKEDIANELPIYMVPSYIIQLDSMPLNQNGKIDKKALPEVKNYIVEEYVPAQNEIQRNMEKVFAKVLGKDKVSIRSNFFDIGGDSIKSIQIASKLKKYNIIVEVKDIFKYKTIEEIYKYIKEKKVIAEQGTIEGTMSLTPVQRQLIESENEGFNNFNESRMLYSKAGFKEDILKIVFTRILEHHDAFRVIIKNEQGKTYLYNRGIDEKLYDFYTYDLSNAESLEKEIEDRCNSIQQSIDLEKGSIIKFGLFKTRIGDYLSVFVHQFVIDEITWRIILEDLTNGYKALNEGKSFEWSKKTTSFKEWSEKQNEYANNPKFLRELNYWEEVALQPVQNIPKKMEESKIKNSNIVTVSLDKLKTKELLSKVNKAYDTEIKDILISALSIATRKWTNLDKLGVTLQGHGRENILKDVDVTRTAGCFTSYYPVVLDLDSEDIGRTIINTRDNLRSVPNKGIGYGILKYLTRETKKSINIDIKTEISFNYLGKLDNNESNEEITRDALLEEKIIENKFKLRDGINITSTISNDILGVNIVYDTEAYEEKSIKEFGELFINALNVIVNHCAEREQLEDTNIENVVLLRKSYRSKNNIFIIHDGTGNTLGYHEFVDGADLYDYDIYGINFSSKYSQKSEISIEKMASDYIDIIRKIQPQGPYYIFGWSLGGIIGLEMVRQLENNKDVIAKLIVADSYLVNTEVIDIQREIAATKDEAINTKNQVKFKENKYDIKNLSEEDRNIISKGMEEFERNNGYRLNIKTVFIDVINRYNLSEPINNDIYFIQAQESSYWDLNEWANITKGKFTYSKIPGNHLSIFQKPYVDTLIEKFINYIEV